MRPFSIIFILLYTISIYGQGNYFKLEDGTRLFMEERGKGETIIFIPGWTMTHRFFDGQKPFFSRNYHMITYDPRGQGRSDSTVDKNNYASHAADLQELILKKNLQNVVLVGWSSGCLTMFEYIRAYSTDRISKLVFIDEPPKWIGDVGKEWVYGTFDDYRGSLKGMVSVPPNPNGIIEWMLKDPIADDTKAWMSKEILMTPPHVALSLYVDGLACDYTEEVRQLNKPALFLVRESWYEKANKWLSANAQDAKVNSIYSHAMFWEKPDKFNALVLSFLEESD